MQVITVSKQLGSLGDVVAAVVAREKGFRLVSPDQVHERANACDPEYSDACTMYETERGPGFWERVFFDTPSYTALFKSLTYEFASEGKVVITGRGSQLVLRDVPGVFSVRIVAPMRIRIRRIAERYGVGPDRAADIVRKHDRERKALVESIFDHDDSDWAFYDMVLNTTHYTADGAAAVVIKAGDSVEQVPEPEDFKEKLAAMALAKRLETVIKKRLTPAISWQIEVTGEAGGEMTLTGRVSDKRHKEQAGAIAQKYSGVTSVKNDIKVIQFPWGY